MPNDRFFTPQPLAIGHTIPLPEDESHHLVRVMRVKTGEKIEIIDGRGTLAVARVADIQKRHVHVEILTVHHSPPQEYEVIIAQAIPRTTRLDTIVEKGTELGMTQLWLFPGQKSEKTDLTENNQQRIHAQMVAAAKQCGRLYLPTLQIKPPLSRWQDLPYPAFFGDVSPNAPAFRPTAKTSLIFFIGPEAGFSNEEVKLLHQLQAKGVKLHPNTLRTDTAPLVVLGLVSHSNL